MSDINVTLEKVRSLYKDKEWFYDVGIARFGIIVVYAHWMSEDILQSVPDKVDNFPVSVYFAVNKMALDGKYLNDNTKEQPTPLVVQTLSSTYLSEINDEPNKLELVQELSKLEKLCGANILFDIFFEVHDGPNAVTNLGAKFPDVRNSMNDLYNEYGFDVIYEELEG